MNNSPHVRNIATDLIFTLLTCGLFNIYVQYRQILAVNDMIKENKYDFGNWAFLCLVTCGLYQIYHEYRQSEDIERVTGREASKLSLLAVGLTVVGLHVICDAIQQSHINAYYGVTRL